MTSNVTYYSRLGFSFTYDSSGEEMDVDQSSRVPFCRNARYVHVEFKNSKVAFSDTVGQRSLQRVKDILAGSEDPDETAERYKKALESERVLPSHKLLLLFNKPTKPEWPFPCFS